MKKKKQTMRVKGIKCCQHTLKRSCNWELIGLHDSYQLLEEIILEIHIDQVSISANHYFVRDRNYSGKITLQYHAELGRVWVIQSNS